MHLNNQLKNLTTKLKKNKIKIAVAESCTGGLISYNLTKIPGASKFFMMGIVSYSNISKLDLLKVRQKTLTKYGAVSAEICKEMCNNLLKISKTNIAISVTGIAGPDGGTKKKPIGLVYVGICSKNKFEIKKFNFGKKLSRINIQNLTLKKTIKLIENHINTL
ncbi:cinA_cterm, competence/damage-inducible protein CinA C-terminal domain [Candidatus Pelagibacterales bacterium]|jgi:nicotinamide-nucleotide amidase